MARKNTARKSTPKKPEKTEPESGPKQAETPEVKSPAESEPSLESPQPSAKAAEDMESAPTIQPSEAGRKKAPGQRIRNRIG